MAAENGAGSGGGNSSVWWEIRHGSQKRPQDLAVAGLSDALPAASGSAVGVIDRPASGQVKLTKATDKSHARVEIHDRTKLNELGGPDHPGMFRVRLRIRRAEIDALIAADPTRKEQLDAYWAALPGIARTLQVLTGPVPIQEGEQLPPDDVFLVIDVPAIERKPKNGEDWPFLPWEMYWQW